MLLFGKRTKVRTRETRKIKENRTEQEKREREKERTK